MHNHKELQNYSTPRNDTACLDDQWSKQLGVYCILANELD